MATANKLLFKDCSGPTFIRFWDTKEIGKFSSIWAENGSLRILRTHLLNCILLPSLSRKLVPRLRGRMVKNAKRKIVGWIFRAWVTRKDGTRDWAKDHGLKAWRIPIYAD